MESNPMQHKLFYGLKILAVIGLAEMAIMWMFSVFGLDRGAWWLGGLDALLLACIVSFAIYFWVVRPLSQAADRNHIFQMVSKGLDVGLVITDPRLPDHPIISVNPAFSTITGYSEAEALGRNPRFLQGPKTDPATLAEISARLKNNLGVHVTQLNYRKDGSTFWNDLRIDPVFDGAGKPRYFVGLITDVSERIERKARKPTLQLWLKFPPG